MASKTTYKNVNATPTWKLQEIVNSNHCTGIDGTDYFPVKHELEQELWRRQELELAKLMAQYEKDQKEYNKYVATSHKRKVAV